MIHLENQALITSTDLINQFAVHLSKNNLPTVLVLEAYALKILLLFIGYLQFALGTDRLAYK